MTSLRREAGASYAFVERNFNMVELAPREKQRHERDAGDEGEHGVVAGEQAPGRSGVGAVSEVEKSGDDGDLIACINGVKHEPFGELVERDDE